MFFYVKLFSERKTEVQNNSIQIFTTNDEKDNNLLKQNKVKLYVDLLRIRECEKVLIGEELLYGPLKRNKTSNVFRSER